MVIKNMGCIYIKYTKLTPTSQTWQSHTTKTFTNEPSVHEWTVGRVLWIGSYLQLETKPMNFLSNRLTQSTTVLRVIDGHYLLVVLPMFLAFHLGPLVR